MNAIKLRIVLDHKEDGDVFRDVIIHKDVNFEKLHRIICDAFQFSGQEMASFYLSDDEWNKGQEIAQMDMGLPDTLLMQETYIDEVFPGKAKQVIYLYDHLRMWLFLVHFMGEAEIQAPLEYDIPVAIGTAPKEDSKEIDLGADELTADDYLGADFEDELDDDLYGNDDDFESLDDLPEDYI